MTRPVAKWDGKLHLITLRGTAPEAKRLRGLRLVGALLKPHFAPYSRAERKDRKEGSCSPAARLTELKAPAAGVAAGASVAIYAHFNRRGSVSAMVLKQLRLLSEAGFHLIFVSMSELADANRRAALEEIADRIYTRRSFGRDFGAWSDVWMQHHAELLAANEVLLLNDSMLGPVRPLAPVLAAMRAQEGVTGLTDSADHVGHMQSFFMLFRGQPALTALDRFFDALELSFDKTKMIARGELGLARSLRAAGISCRVAFPFEVAEARGLADLEFLERLAAAYPTLVSGQPLPDPADAVARRRFFNHMRATVWRTGLNPTHYYWRVLVEEMGFPFLKTELLISNPACVPDVPDWPEVVGHDAPVTVEDIREHLEMVA